MTCVEATGEALGEFPGWHLERVGDQWRATHGEGCVEAPTMVALRDQLRLEAAR
ncbi:hypothetical protein OG884_24670 [Streptosporangium sp. NBC_01755]|uniref:hypothetical protein n=1 Tax=Streptosporangium sp. NBC_01755 TaxID=2975949 RepID=UPI002DDA1F33|nr:hypothetical protein [Streptosporangium sp. NBC_01755]WSC98070.1 hypothetical protein OG884_24670 [Streptosporangium sp. NBC_01755]